MQIKGKKVNLGIFLIIIGLVWILSNFNLIDINLYGIIKNMVRGIFDLWPLILIIIGLGIIFKNDLLNTILWILFLLVLVVYSLFIKDSLIQKDFNDLLQDQEYTTEMTSDIERGRLDLDIGATTFTIDPIDDVYGDFIRLEQDGNFNYRFKNKASIETMYLSNKSDLISNRKGMKFDLALNRDIPWEFNMNVGAVTGKLNLKDIMVRNINLDMGAGSIEMTLGKKNNFTSIDIDAGASKILIKLPKDVGAKIEFDGALNSTNLDSLDLTKTPSGQYISEDYDDAINKYEIGVDMGVGQFDIIYY